MRRLYVILASLLLILWTTFLGFMFRRETGLQDERLLGIAVSQARALFDQMSDVRAWNSSHGGVYVPITEATPPNPWLQAADRDVTTDGGRRLTLMNHAYMTRQLAEITRERRGVSLHLTSLNPLRPGNAPDGWERTALAAFDRGERERVDFTLAADGKETFRYMAPLYIEESCLPCHAQQGYRIGQVRGGLSIGYPAGLIVASRRAFRRNALLASVVIWSLGAGLIAAVTWAYHQKSLLVGRLRELTLVDELTGLHNRRGFLLLAEQQLQIARRAFRPDLLLFVDLDGMKAINDEHGHAAGDAALMQVATVLRAAFRSSDILSRFGGDEFALLCPDTGMDALRRILDELERRIAEANARSTAPWKISVSAGAAAFDPASPSTLEALLADADAAMYRAKAAKRHASPPA